MNDAITQRLSWAIQPFHYQYTIAPESYDHSQKPSFVIATRIAESYPRLKSIEEGNDSLLPV